MCLKVAPHEELDLWNINGLAKNAVISLFSEMCQLSGCLHAHEPDANYADPHH
jgi:hypothetical protein